VPETKVSPRNEAAGPDIHLQLDMKVSFQSSGGGSVWELVFAPSNFSANVDFPWWSEVLVALIDPICSPAVAIGGGPLADCMSLLEDYIARQIEKSFTAPSQRVKVSLPSNCLVPAVEVDPQGALWFSCAQFKSSPVWRGVVNPRSLLLQ